MILLDLSVRVNVPQLFQARADEQVQQAAEKAVANQTEAMKKFFAEHADEQVALPKLGGKWFAPLLLATILKRFR